MQAKVFHFLDLENVNYVVWCHMLCNADFASSGDHVTRWTCDLKISSSKSIHPDGYL
jgi:hypothetical protein